MARPNSLGDSAPFSAEQWILFAQTKFSNVIRDLPGIQPDLLEFLMSTNEAIRNSVRSSSCGAAFPTTRALWINSISCSLLQRFLAYFNRLPPNLLDHTIDGTCRQVMPYIILLSALGEVQFHDTQPEEGASTNHKRCRYQNTCTIDSQLFTVLGLPYPTTPQELQEVEAQVLQRLEALLDVLISAFENPGLAVYSRMLVFGSSQQTNKPVPCPQVALKIRFGKVILFCYRRYALRKRMKMKKAVKTIKTHYFRCRLRCKFPMTATEEQVRKLHNEYKKDAQFIRMQVQTQMDYSRAGVAINALLNMQITIGGGSGAAFAPYIVTPLEGIQSRTKANSTQVSWMLNDLDLATVETNAIIADTSIVFTYSYQTERVDPDNLTLWSNGDALITTVAAECNNTIVVIHSGQQVLMESWIDNPNVTAVVFAYYPGQETGNAIASILYGEVNPSGKASANLPFTLSKSLSDYPPNGIYTENVSGPHVVFEEGNLVDYRWFDAKNVTPRFEFGFVMSYFSYTTFSYNSIRLQSTPGKPTDGVQLTKEPFDGKATLYDVAYTVTASVKNTGSVSGCEVAQLYLSYPASQTKQPTKTATFKLRQKDHAVWDVVRQTWTIPKGVFTVYVGSSSRTLPLKTTFTV
ncbi:unnamed protein product [Rhizoctonia solani]|uniref:beta-glucosidase n=1 Tax=Rhizoctonia solani TaxID=456999 RepID=A0A8H3GFH5_9AGAM|nr:unnamed protein product [Rhizoctonia solani]